MKPRTSQAKLLRFEEQDGTKIEVTYAPSIENGSVVFKAVGRRILPIHVSVQDIWKTVRQKWIDEMARAESSDPENFNPDQFEMPEVVKVAAQVPDEVLPETGPEVVQEPVVREVPPPEVAREEPIAVCVREPEAPSEAARTCVPFKLRRISDVRKADGLRPPEGDAQQVAHD